MKFFPRPEHFLTTRNVRRLVQSLFLLLFLFLFIQTETKGNDELGYPVRLFLDFDPLILVTTLLSAHAVAKAFVLSLAQMPRGGYRFERWREQVERPSASPVAAH